MVSLNVNGLTASKLITVLGHLKSKEPGAPMAFALQETHETITHLSGPGVWAGDTQPVLRSDQTFEITPATKTEIQKEPA